MAGNPFQKAEAVPKRVKIFLWGETGAGKTTLSLQFPKPAVIDMEGSTDLYGKTFDFDVLPAFTVLEFVDACKYLRENNHEYRTLIIDPITVLWDAMQKKWSDIFFRQRTKGKQGHKNEFYEFTGRDWMTVKQDWKDIMRQAFALDMNVIAIARAKDKFSMDGEARGSVYDGEKSLPYLFDTVIQLRRRGNLVEGWCTKDRSNCLPTEDWFNCSYESISKMFANRNMDRESQAVQGIDTTTSSEINRLISLLGLSPERVRARLSKFGVEYVEELTASDGEEIYQKLKQAHLESRKSPQPQHTEPVDESQPSPSPVNGNGSLKEISAKFKGKCHGCDAEVKKGERVLYDPGAKKVYCLICGRPAKISDDTVAPRPSPDSPNQNATVRYLRSAINGASGHDPEALMRLEDEYHQTYGQTVEQSGDITSEEYNDRLAWIWAHKVEPEKAPK